MTRSGGQRLGRYTLLHPLGRGGMGEVWAAVLHGPSGFEKPVALKLLHCATDEALRRTLVSEARMGAALHHPNVVATWALEVLDGEWLIAMERVDGVTVKTLVESGALPAAAVVEIGLQACHGLRHIHEQRAEAYAGLVHRDIKPANLLVDRAGLVKIADLGIAALAGTGGAVGTPGFAPPEQLAGDCDARSDLFALGATLYWMATGKRAFGRGAQALYAVHRVSERLPELCAAGEARVHGLGEILQRALQPSPDQRFESAREMGQALAALGSSDAGLAELVATAMPAETSTQTPRPNLDTTWVACLGNLPHPIDRFVGRADEVCAVRDTLAGARLVTILGPGGIGKTRLGLEVARLAQEASIEVWFFDLSEATTTQGVCFTIARDLCLRLDRPDVVAQIGHALASRGPTLVLLDNLEQVVDGVVTAVGKWLALAPQVRILTTSRRPLRIQGERTLRLGPLPTADGVSLFLDRCATPPPAAHEPDVRRLVKALDGMPLALELAAARTSLFPVPQLRRRLEQRLDLLSGGGPDLPERHRSLVASLQWSWDLASSAARSALAMLSVFEGGCSLDDVEAILATEGTALDAVQELADASLVRVDPHSGRLSLFRVVQAFGADQLEPSARRAAEVRHGMHYARFHVPTLPVETLLCEADNFVVACERALERGDGEVAGRTAILAAHALWLRGPLQRSTDLLLPALEIAVDAQHLDVLEACCEALILNGQDAVGMSQRLVPRSSGGGGPARGVRWPHHAGAHLWSRRGSGGCQRGERAVHRSRAWGGVTSSGGHCTHSGRHAPAQAESALAVP